MKCFINAHCHFIHCTCLSVSLPHRITFLEYDEVLCVTSIKETFNDDDRD